MLLIHKEQQISVEDRDDVIQTILEKVNKLIEQQGVIFSHLLVDGIEVYENHEMYIKERKTEIMEIEIITHTVKEMIWKTMQSVQEYLERAIPALNALIEKSYDDFSQATWEGINQLAEGMQWMLQFTTFTNASNEQPAHWPQVASSIVTCEKGFAQLLEAVEMQDTVLTLDILSYEIFPAYETLFKRISIALQDEEYMNHVN